MTALPEHNPKAACLMKMLDNQIAAFQNRREHDRKMAFRLQIAGTSLSALTTILLGLQFKSHETTVEYLRNIALCFSAAVTVFSAWESFFDYKSLWIKYTKTRSQLRALKAKLEYQMSSGQMVEEEQLDGLFNQYQAILAEANNSWLQVKGDEAHGKDDQSAEGHG